MWIEIFVQTIRVLRDIDVLYRDTKKWVKVARLMYNFTTLDTLDTDL